MVAAAELLGIDDLEAKLGQVRRRCEEEIGAAAPGARAALGSGAIHGAGIRATLTVATAELGGVFDERVVDAAAAIELVQTGSLVHDDIVDGAATRRGHPSVVATRGIGEALVIGDLVLAIAARLALRAAPEAAGSLTDAMADMAGGQLEELASLGDADRTLDTYREASRRKTGALFAAACNVGALLGGAPPSHRAALTRYGEAFGTAYQLADDVLDVVDGGDRGKAAHADIREGNYTGPTLWALQGRRAEVLRSLLRRRGDADAVARAYEEVRASQGIQQTMDAIDRLATAAGEELRALPDSALVRRLRAFPTAYLRTVLPRPTSSPASMPRRRAPLRATRDDR